MPNPSPSPLIQALGEHGATAATDNLPPAFYWPFFVMPSYASASLPFTGLPLVPMAMLGVLLLFAGAVLIRFTRKRATAPTS